MANNTFTEKDQYQLEQIMRQRRDVRGNAFIDKEISKDVLDKILLAASLAPSVGFSQPWEFVIIKEDQIKKQIANCFESENKKAEKIFSDKKKKIYSKLKLEGIIEAPVNIAVWYKPSVKPVLGQNTLLQAGEYSVVCAIQNMWLMSRALNIGMGWVSILDSETVKKILKAPPENKLIAYLCLGYVKEFTDKPELEKINWEKRKSMNTFIYHNSYPEN
jgi:5,6-dimethylbenzimidazole synthase